MFISHGLKRKKITITIKRLNELYNIFFLCSNNLLSDKKQAGSIELKLVCSEKCRGPTEVKWLQEFCNVHCADKLHTPQDVTPLLYSDQKTKLEERFDNLKRICQESCLTEEKGHFISQFCDDYCKPYINLKPVPKTKQEEQDNLRNICDRTCKGELGERTRDFCNSYGKTSRG
ncbi:uncharacterized protein LOC100678502 [Nasonia vitripennis]|uniref:Uncharacterized protein n=1 Tax=Nasonia vitripennis TaxID=7425 RepID=A0A7M7QEN5_NASVI|nr:uncharacterized protein LOC100678502 [Nasonia vitripennis]